MSTTEETPRRLVSADVIRMLHEQALAMATRQSEPWVTVEITDAAKGEVRIVTKVSAPLGCDVHALADHAAEVRRIAQENHERNESRKEPEPTTPTSAGAVAGIVARNAREKAKRDG